MKYQPKDLSNTQQDYKDTLADALSGWKYIRETYGDLYGVGWDRVQNKLEEQLRARSSRINDDFFNFKMKKPSWISTKTSLPPLLKDHDYSENVWGWDGKNILVVSFFQDDENWNWGNAYGDVFGDALFDDDYDIKYWQPIATPAEPNLSVGDTDA